MFALPPNFQWLAPWSPVGDQSICLEWGQIQATLESGERIGDYLVEELRREMPAGHVLKDCGLVAIGRCLADPNEFLFATDSPETPLAVVHLTWHAETNPVWPFTRTYRTVEDWVTQMKAEHKGQFHG
jgi:hypothetical protein